MWHIHYVSNCEPKLISFSSQEQATKFITNFMLKHQFTRTAEDNWIDIVFHGAVIYKNPDFK